MPENTSIYIIASLGGGQRDSMKNWIFKIPDFCLKPLSPVTFVKHKHYWTIMSIASECVAVANLFWWWNDLINITYSEVHMKF